MKAEKRWVMPDPIAVPTAFQQAIGGHPLVTQNLYQRGFQTVSAAFAFLDPDKYQPAPASELPDLAVACDLLAKAIRGAQHILVWGDFDVDGQTATTVLVEGLRQFGAVVSYHIPVRAEESHGITLSALQSKLKTGFDLLLTCDTGITEHDNLQIVRNLGIPVVVTDHHTLGERLPPANAVINPQRLPPDHPLRTLPGVGVAYKLIEGLSTWLDQPIDLGHLLELAALGIVADLAELTADTRYLLQKGLRHLRETDRLGLQMLFNITGLDPANLNESHVGFQIAPRLNAIGRLGDANPMVDFLTTNDEGRARLLAYHIEAINTDRRFHTRQVQRAAEMQLSASSADRHAPAILLYHPNWPGGVVGIVANHLVERYHKPAILLTGEDPIHGSARSVPGVHITKAIAAQSDLLNGFGGHPMAAGLSMPAANYTAFKRRFLATVGDLLRGVELLREIPIAQELTLNQLNLGLVREIERLGPFGPGNPPLLFLVRELALVSDSLVGANQEHRQVTVADQAGNELRLIWWNGGDEPLPEAQFDLVCKLTHSDYKGVPQLSAEWVDFRLSQAGLEAVEKRQVDIIDYRDAFHPQTRLMGCLRENPDAILWGEGDLPGDLPFTKRHQLQESPHLIIWTAPPSQAVLRHVLQATQPHTVTVFGVDPNLDNPHRFLNRLAGAAKYAINTLAGQVTLHRLAGSCAADITTVSVGLQLWEAKGELSVKFSAESVHISLDAPQPDPHMQAKYHDILQNLLEESRAYRAFFRRGDLGTLFK